MQAFKRLLSLKG